MGWQLTWRKTQSGLLQVEPRIGTKEGQEDNGHSAKRRCMVNSRLAQQLSSRVARGCTGQGKRRQQLLLLPQPCLGPPFWMGVPVSSTRRRQFRLVSAEMVLLPWALFSLQARYGAEQRVRAGSASLRVMTAQSTNATGRQHPGATIPLTVPWEAPRGLAHLCPSSHTSRSMQPARSAECFRSVS